MRYHQFFFKKVYLKKTKKLMVMHVTRWKTDNYVLILLKMYWTTFTNTSGNVLKIVTIKNDAKFS